MSGINIHLKLFHPATMLWTPLLQLKGVVAVLLQQTLGRQWEEMTANLQVIILRKRARTRFRAMTLKL